MKIALNRHYGGFEASELLYSELGFEWDGYGYLDNEMLNIKSDNDLAYRTDPRVIEAIEKIGERNASGPNAYLQIIEIPDDISWEINDYDGIETIHEIHRS